MEEIILANAALALLNALLPRIEKAFKAGQVSTDEQQTVRDNYLKLRNAGAQAFFGPEWDDTTAGGTGGAALGIVK